MGLKPDHWIRKMALEQRMIEPFVDGQVRDGVISYGLSSYGYDIRVADEFKIFQPEITAAKLSDVQCAYVAGLLDAQGRIGYEAGGAQGRPGLALVISGDDRRLLEGWQALIGAGRLREQPDGRVELIVSKAADVQYILSQVWPYLTQRREMASRALAELKANKSIIVDPKNFDADSFVDFKGDVCVIPPNSFALSRTVEYFRIPRSTLTICLGKSSYARCFRGDTRVALIDGTAPTLEEMARRAEDGEMFWGYSVGPYGRIIVTLLESPRYIGHESLVEIVLDTGESIFCTPDHRFLTRAGVMVEAHQLRPGSSLLPLYRQIARGYEMLFQPLDGRMCPTHRLADEWNLRHGVYEDAPNTHRHHRDGDRRNNRPWNIVRMDASEHIHLHNQESYGQDFDPDEHSKAIREALDRLAQDPAWNEHYRRVQQERALQFWRDDAYMKIREDVVNFPEVIHAFKGQQRGDNHKIVAVRDLPGDHDVYCLTVPEAGNFALEAGIFVSNCGIIVNVTPFEPCFSDDTEILTPEGWRLMRDVQVGDCVMGMSLDGYAEYQPVIAKQEYDYDGELLHFEGKSIDLLVSPEHKVLVNRRTNGRKTRKGDEKSGWHTTTAREIFGGYNYEMLREVRWKGNPVEETVVVNGDVYPTNPFLRFLGLWLGDGSAYVAQKEGRASGYVVQIAAFNQKREYVKRILDELGVHYNEMREGFRFYRKSLYDYLAPYVHAENKHVPREWFNLDPGHLKLILEGLLMSDGNLETQTITTCSKRLADDIQMMAFLSGQSAIVREVKPNGKTRFVNGQEIRSNQPVYKVRLTSGQLTPKIAPSRHKKVPYRGKIYDVTVSNHLIFVRRNGKPVWSGNCWEGFVTLEISNTTPLPAKIYANEGIAQVLFFEADEECEVSYADRKGKYQAQQSIVLPRL